MVRAVLLVLAALLIWPTAVWAETAAEYRSALVETAEAAGAALSTLPTDASLANHPPLRYALARLESIDLVTTESHASVVVDNRVLIARLRGSREQGVQAYDSLRQLIEALDSVVEQVERPDGADARAALDTILARPEFGSATGNPIARFLDDLRTSIFRWLEGLFTGVGLPGLDLAGPLEVLFWLFAGALIIFSMIFFGFTWRNARQNLARYAALPSRTVIEREDARTAQLAAQRAADAGDYRLAIHYLYLWAVLHLSKQARLRYDRSLTNHEHLRALATDGDVADLLRAAVESFDRLWYGHAACTAAEYGQFRDTVDRLVEAAA